MLRRKSSLYSKTSCKTEVQIEIKIEVGASDRRLTLVTFQNLSSRSCKEKKMSRGCVAKSNRFTACISTYVFVEAARQARKPMQICEGGETTQLSCDYKEPHQLE